MVLTAILCMMTASRPSHGPHHVAYLAGNSIVFFKDGRRVAATPAPGRGGSIRYVAAWKAFAMFDGKGFLRFDPETGRVLARVDLPVSADRLPRPAPPGWPLHPLSWDVSDDGSTAWFEDRTSARLVAVRFKPSPSVKNLSFQPSGNPGGHEPEDCSLKVGPAGLAFTTGNGVPLDDGGIYWGARTLILSSNGSNGRTLGSGVPVMVLRDGIWTIKRSPREFTDELVLYSVKGKKKAAIENVESAGAARDRLLIFRRRKPGAASDRDNPWEFYSLDAAGHDAQLLFWITDEPPRGPAGYIAGD